MTTMSEIDLDEVVFLIDKRWLYNSLWKLKDDFSEAEKVFWKVVGRINELELEPKIVYEVLNTADIEQFSLVKPILEKMMTNTLRASPSINSGHGGASREAWPKQIALIASTIGSKVKDIGQSKFDKGEFVGYFYISGFAAAMAEATAEYGHRKICEEVGVPRKESFRISPGYPVWLDLSEQKKIAKLLPLDQIGVTLSDTNQLIPEHSTTAMIFL